MENHMADNEHATLLVVGDDLLFSHLIRDTLENVGYHVLTALNGEEALRTFLKFQPDLILSDTSMPIVDGTQLLEAVRSTPEGKTIPFILIYPGVSIDDLSYAESMGARCIVSPFYVHKMLSAVQACLEHSGG